MGKKYDSIGITCDIFSAKNETEHFHRDIELDFIIEGNIRVVIEDNDFDLKSEDIILVDSNKKHYIYVDDEALVCRINISYDMLVEMLDDEYVMFLCNILTEKDTGYEDIRSIIKDIIYLKMEDDRKNAFRLMECYGRLLNCFVRNFRVTISEDSRETGYNDAERIRDLLNYININYQDPINLANLADQMFVSVSTLSRNFKKATGMKFPDYVNQIRMHYAISDLLNTNKSITEIAVDNGFSSPSSFNRVFREMYNTTPSQYKKSMRSLVENEKAALTRQEEDQVRRYLNERKQSPEEEKNEDIININPSEDQIFYNIANQTVNLGAFYTLASSSVQMQVRQMAQQLNLKYLRMWNVFSPRCMIAESPEERSLSFEQVDIVLDFMTGIGLHPMLDMSFHPEVLIKSGKELIFKREDNMGFKNIDQWSYFLDKFMEHVVFRYGSNEVEQWIFEMPDLPTSGNEFAYYENNKYKEVFRTAYTIIKKAVPEAKTGGPCWVLDGNELDIHQYFTDWNETGCMPDFYSVLIFPYKNPAYNRDIYYYDKERSMDPDFMKNQIRDIHRMLDENDAPLKPLYVSEITSILSNRNALNDHCGRGTNVLRIANEFQKYADMICFWVATDRLSLHYAPPGVLHGGSGLMSKDGIPKPSYYALYFMAKLGTNLLAKGEGYMAVQNAPGNIYIMCYNHKKLKYNYKYEESKQVNVYNVDTMFDDTGSMTLKFMVNGLEAGEEYVIKQHVVNQECGSVMDEWKRLDYEPEMRGNDIDYLKSVCVPRIHMKRRIAQQGKIMLEAKMAPHEMLLLHIYK